MQTDANRIESEETRQALQTLAAADGFIELPDFVKFALFHPKLGYYPQDRIRVGRNQKSDFYTSTSFREAFAAIVSEASCDALASKNVCPEQCHWVEIGAEPEGGLLSSKDSPFKTTQTIRLGNALEIPNDSPCVVFSNELFDAQPFRQVRFEDGAWREYGLKLESDQLTFCRRHQLSSEALDYLRKLPERSNEGYTIDIPTGANALARDIATQQWSGLFLAFDYGKTRSALVLDSPQGSARAYSRHQQRTDILNAPGQQDITHHICWDDLSDELAAQGFETPRLESQEAFIVKRAPKFMQQAFDPSRNALDPIRGMLKQLMLPNFMGQKFQALSTLRS